MSTKNIVFPKNSLERLINALDQADVKKWGRNKEIAEKTGYSQSQVSVILSGKEPLNDRFLKLVSGIYGISEDWVKYAIENPPNNPALKGTGKIRILPDIEEKRPLTIAEQIGEGYAPEVKLMADYLEVKLQGKTREERLKAVEEIMADIRERYK